MHLTALDAVLVATISLEALYKTQQRYIINHLQI